MPNTTIYKVVHTPKSGQTWDETRATELVMARDVRVNNAWGIVKDTFSFRLSKGDKYYDGVNASPAPEIFEQDMIRVWMRKNPDSNPYVWTYDDLMIEGTVRGVNQSVGDGGNMLEIQGNNFAEVFFNVELPIYFSEKNWLEMLREIVTLKLARDLSVKLIWDPENPDRKKDGITEFPLKYYAVNYTPVFTIIDQLSGEDYTGDGKYIWYIRPGPAGERYFSVRPQSAATEIQIIDESLPCNSVSIDRNKDNIKNFIIYNVGINLYGQSVEDYYYDSTSIGRYGWGTYYMINETGNIFSSLYENEVKNNRSRFTFDANNNLSDVFPTTYTPAYVFQDGTSVTTNAAFNQHLQDIALAQGKQFAINYSQTSSKGFYTVNITLPFTKAFIVGKKYEVIFTLLRKFTAKLRLKTMDFTQSQVSLSFDQDIIDRNL